MTVRHSHVITYKFLETDDNHVEAMSRILEELSEDENFNVEVEAENENNIVTVRIYDDMFNDGQREELTKYSEYLTNHVLVSDDI
jgi:hypothetical protein